MIYCKIVKDKEFTNKCPNPVDVYRVTNYVLNPTKSCHDISGGNYLFKGKEFLYTDPIYIANQFLTVQGDMSGCSRRLYHIVLSFDFDTSLKIYYSQIKYIAEMIINLYPGHQSVYALHENTGHAHIHFLFNNIPVVRNTPKLTGLMNIQKIENMVDSYVSKYIYKIPNN